MSPKQQKQEKCEKCKDWKSCKNPFFDDSTIRPCYKCGVDTQFCGNCKFDHHVEPCCHTPPSEQEGKCGDWKCRRNHNHLGVHWENDAQPRHSQSIEGCNHEWRTDNTGEKPYQFCLKCGINNHQSVGKEESHKEKIERGAVDFANRFEGVMKELAEEESNSLRTRSWVEDFKERYCNFEISERISKPDMLNIISFIQSVEDAAESKGFKNGLGYGYNTGQQEGKAFTLNILKEWAKSTSGATAVDARGRRFIDLQDLLFYLSEIEGAKE